MSRFRVVFRPFFAGSPWITVRSPKMSRYGIALRPLVSSNPWANSRSPFEMLDQHFGLGMDLNDLFQPTSPFLPLDYYGAWGQSTSEDSGTSSVAMEKNVFKITMDVQHFKPEEISVKQMEDSVVVEGKHEETEDDHGYVSRHFVRRYVLPKGVDHHALNSTLSSDGVLTITAPKVEQMDGASSRTIPIEKTGKHAFKDVERKGTKK